MFNTTMPANLSAWAAERNASILDVHQDAKAASFAPTDYVRFLNNVSTDSGVNGTDVFLPAMLAFVPSDPCYANNTNIQCLEAPAQGQWNLKQVHMPQAWDRTLGSDNVVVAVLDTGAMFLHPDLDQNTWTNPNELINGQDDDNNGCIDDIHGCTFVASHLVLPGSINQYRKGTGAVIDGSDVGHGTHVSGIATAEINNSELTMPHGIAGLSNGTYMPVRIFSHHILGTSGGSFDDFARGMRYAVDAGAKVLSHSWITTYTLPGVLDHEISNAWGQGRLIVAAAGNQGPECNSFGLREEVVIVGATRISGGPTGYSCPYRGVDIVAPGGDDVGVFSTIPTGFAQRSGTSMAAPHVSAAASLIWSVNNALSNQQVAAILYNSAADIDPSGRDDKTGHGLLNVSRALDIAASASAPVAFFRASPLVGTTATPIQVDAGDSFDLNSSETQDLNYTWSWGDGTTTYGKTSSHTYTDPSNRHVIRLTLRDPLNNTATITETVQIARAESSNSCGGTLRPAVNLTIGGPLLPNEGLFAPVSLVDDARTLRLHATRSDCDHDLRYHIEVWTTTPTCPSPCYTHEQNITTSWHTTGPWEHSITYQPASPGKKRFIAYADTRLTNTTSPTNRSDAEGAFAIVLPRILQQGTLDAGKAFGVLDRHGVPIPSLRTHAVNDSWVARQWANSHVRQAEAHTFTTPASNVTVAIVDSGVDYLHEDLAANMWSLGLLRGADFSTSPDIPGLDPKDDLGHGTHLAGIISAVQNNSKGIAGVASGVKIMPVKVGTQNVSAPNLAAGIKWAVDHGAHIILLASTGPNDVLEVRNATLYAEQQNVVVVAAAGNQNTSTPRYPAAYNTVLAVAGTNAANLNATFSNNGTWVDLAAPSVGIISTWAPLALLDANDGALVFESGDATNDTWGIESGPLNRSLLSNLGKAYGNMTGTSAAAAFVAGVAALTKSANPGLTPAQLRMVLRKSATDIGPSGSDVTFGAGLVDAARGVIYARSLPTAEFNVTVTGGTVEVNGELSQNPLGTALNYTWNWGGGTHTYGQVSSRHFNDTGEVTITLTVRNEFELEASKTRRVFVFNGILGLGDP